METGQVEALSKVPLSSFYNGENFWQKCLRFNGAIMPPTRLWQPWVTQLK
jgi:hypothetical protein